MRRNNFHVIARFDILGSVSKIVILAAGRGRRMRKDVPGLALEPEQERMAARGLKALIPIHGRAYLDYVMSAAADAGFEDVCLVVGPGRDPIAARYAHAELRRVRLHVAVQLEPLGTADALLAAEPFAAGEPVTVINCDNYYPARALAALNAWDGSAMVGFRADTLTSRGNIPVQRLAAYALAFASGDGHVTRIIEKPDPTAHANLSQATTLEPGVEPGPWISMTCWRFGHRIFDACRSVGRSVRGELELVDAVSYAIDELGERFRVLPVDEPVLDLSCREDIGPVSRWLGGREVRL